MLGKILVILILMFQNNNCKTKVAGLEIDSETKIRFIEIYGSICCPRDYKYDTHLIKYIKTFEKKYNVDLESNFKLPLGKEGEAAYFLSLEKLSLELQEKFVIQRLEMLKINDQSIINHLENFISIKLALKPWKNKSINNLLKI